MIAKEYLNHIKVLEYALSDKRAELKRLEALATSITAPTDREAVQTSNISDKTGSFGAMIADIKKEIMQQAAEFLEEKRKRIYVIDSVRSCDAVQGTILHKHYIAYMPLRLIAKELNYSYDYTRHLHQKALKTAETFIYTEVNTQ